MMWDFILRLFVAGILGAVVGLDREYRAKEAGYRTHFLVSLGSALIMVASVSSGRVRSSSRNNSCGD